MNRSQKGFTLLEILLVVAIIGIIAAIATISYTAAIQRARQKKTITDMRAIATAWESRAADSHTFIPAGFTFPTTAVSYEELFDTLSPTYLRRVPRMDGWGRPFEFGVGSIKDYGIRSAGNDGVFETTYTSDITTDPDCDIVYANGGFVVYPDNAIKK